ncbi:hypothetical protein ACROYT_G014013 [Oculina patagonica]
MHQAHKSTPIKSLISQNDLIAFVCSNREDLKLFLDEVREKRGLNVNVVTPPDEPLESFKPSRSLELRQWGFFYYLKDMITLHDDVMRYLCHSYHIHDIPVGNDWTTRNKEKVIKESGVKFFYTWTLKVSLHMRCQPVQQNLNLAHLLYLRSTHPGPISIKRFYAHRLTLTKTGLIQCTQMFFANEVLKENN